MHFPLLAGDPPVLGGHARRRRDHGMPVVAPHDPQRPGNSPAGHVTQQVGLSLAAEANGQLQTPSVADVTQPTSIQKSTVSQIKDGKRERPRKQQTSQGENHMTLRCDPSAPPLPHHPCFHLTSCRATTLHRQGGHRRGEQGLHPEAQRVSAGTSPGDRSSAESRRHPQRRPLFREETTFTCGQRQVL